MDDRMGRARSRHLRAHLGHFLLESPCLVPQEPVFSFTKDLPRLASFYESLLDMSRAHASADLVVLCSPDIQLVIHAIPSSFASTISVSSPPVQRDNVVLKFFFTVPSIAGARAGGRPGGQHLSIARDCARIVPPATSRRRRDQPARRG